MACAVSTASLTSAFPKVSDPYSDRLRFHLSRSDYLSTGGAAHLSDLGFEAEPIKSC
jgi:hypothetical protein